MARTSKTKIGGESGEQGDRMIRAAASGAEAVSQAHSQLMAQGRYGSEQTMQTAKFAADSINQHQDRETQKQQFDSRMEQDASQFSQKMAQDESQFSRGLEQRESETELEAAKAGFEKGGGEQEPAGDRQAKLEAEMQKGQSQPKLGPLDPESQQRLSDTSKQPLEMDGQGRWRPTQERKELQARQQKREDFQADTERMRAHAYEQQVATSAQKALLAGDMKAYEEHAQILANVPNDRQKQYDRLVKGEVTVSDWADLAKEAADNPEPGLAADIAAKNFSPRVAAFVRAQVGLGALKAIVGSMGDTTKLKVDWTNPVMVQFQQMVQVDAMFMRANQALGQLGFIQSTDDKMRFLNVMAAAKVAAGMGRAPKGKASGGMGPATSPDQQGGGGGMAPTPMGPAHSTPPESRQGGIDAVRDARAGGASPQDALRAGQAADPTASGSYRHKPQQPQMRGRPDASYPGGPR
jgi:hypothetical protein